jgi:hypothetical protein
MRMINDRGRNPVDVATLLDLCVLVQDLTVLLCGILEAENPLSDTDRFAPPLYTVMQSVKHLMRSL